MAMSLVLSFLPQRTANELEIDVSKGGRSLFRTFFRCRTGQTLHPSADALFCLGLYPAAEIGASLRVDGKVDGELRARADAITGLFGDWWQTRRTVDVAAAAAEPPPEPAERGVALFYSGGVDSSFSLVEARPRLSALITLLGVGIPLSNAPATARLERMCRDVAAAKGLEPVVVETDVSRAFHPFASWIEHHGSALAAVGHMLSGGIGRVLIAASGNQATWNAPWGSHPALDPLLGSRRLAVEHHGLVSRFDKIARIVADGVLMRELRVCNRSPRNCGTCDKCAFAMRALEILGLDGHRAFPPFHPRRGRMKIVDDAFLTEIERLRQAAAEADRTDLLPEIEGAMATYRRSAAGRRGAGRRWRNRARLLRHRIRWLRA